MTLFELYDESPTRPDCTRHADVRLLRGCTVGEFCDECLSRTRTWGHIGISLPEKALDHGVFGDVVGEYRWGEDISLDNLAPYRDRKIVGAEYDGGWTYDNYLLHIA